MSKKKTKKPAAATPAAETKQNTQAIPEWLGNSFYELGLPDSSYSIGAFHPGAGQIDGVMVTCHEYQAIKVHLARLRGYVFEGDALPKFGGEFTAEDGRGEQNRWHPS